MTTITISDCSGAESAQTRSYTPRQSTISRALAACDGGCAEYSQCHCDHSDKPHHRRDTLIDMAVRYHFGQGAYFVRDNGLRDQGFFGQIGCNTPGQNNCTSMITGRVHITIEEKEHA